MVWIGALDSKDTKHTQSKLILKRLLKADRRDSLVLSDYTFNEVLRYITTKQKYKKYTEEKREEYVKGVFESIYNSKYVKILKVSESNLGTAFSYMISKRHLVASLTDWLSLILMVENKIPMLASFDSDFKKIVSEISEFNNIKILDK
jgi:predicted nucleic acid-binding protein